MNSRNVPLKRVVDLTDPDKNVIFNMTVDEARELVRTGPAETIQTIDGSFALVTVDGIKVRLARSMDRPLRHFIAKLVDGPCLVVADRVDAIHQWLVDNQMDNQFHPYYTRMVPAHYVTELQLLGCPDPTPTFERFFDPARGTSTDDADALGEAYVRAAYGEIQKWIENKAPAGPLGVCFSGGIDSGAVFLLTLHALLERGDVPTRLKAFTLSVDGGGADVERARSFLEQLDLSVYHESIEVGTADLDWRETVRVVEDYKPLDIEAATMGLALVKGIRARYPQWKNLLDGDGGDENLKDYPIEDNPDLTIRSVLNNSMLYQEGWGVHSIKHSLTYSGGLSRSYARTYAPAALHGFDGFSPFTRPEVIRVAESIPYIQWTDWDHERLYELKGRLVAAGVRAMTGMDMPVFEKCSFQHGALEDGAFERAFPNDPMEYRRAFAGLYS
ncbi:MAG: asparagine synthase-related protein [Gemmatimonadetes bacterium]|nr:asparagine synthase-related protein [Gemmatimonadota bacterium]